MNETIPWVEKYRPTKINNIVLNNHNKIIFSNMIKTNRFPNLLFYGPPGTGKTTTIINLIHEYQIRYNEHNLDLYLHLNASDERGIDVIRGQIQQFVLSNSLFKEGIKFVILDEVDYMTKAAQQALKMLIQDIRGNVRFCLLCNYISRIDESLQSYFMRVHFDNLPIHDILQFLQVINTSEKLLLRTNSLQYVQKSFLSDIRSMVNFMQANHVEMDTMTNIGDEHWKNLTVMIKDACFVEKDVIDYFLNLISIVDFRSAFIEYTVYLMDNEKNILNNTFFEFSEFIIHNLNHNLTNTIPYIILKLRDIFLQYNI